jgi:hypothetical protein
MTQRLEKSALLLLALLLGACGTLNMGDKDDGEGQRRVYVNDGAANDSLRSAMLDGGVYFVMQPGKKYTLQVEGAVAGDYLQMFAASNGFYGFWKNHPGDTLKGTTQTYTVQDSTAAAANYFLVYLRSALGGRGTRPAKVRLLPLNPREPDTLKVHLMMIRTLNGLPTTASKDQFALKFLRELDSIYRAQGIILDTSYQIVEPNAPAFAVDFSDDTDFPGGPRALSNTVYLYLVNNITIDGKSDPFSTILGFAPREAFDLASNEVVLSVERGADPVAIATTAAHEMGHFIGLRHTTSTELDQRGDNDLSNRTDGFAATDSCPVLLGKRVLSKSLNLQKIHTREGRPYCLRTAATNCPACGDLTNLMFPLQCDDDGVVQRTLVQEQSRFIRQNLSLFQR